MPAKIARSTPRPSFGLPELLVAIHISRLASKDAAKSLPSTLVSESSGECRLKAFGPLSTHVRRLHPGRLTVITEESAGQTWAWRRLFHSLG